MKIKYSKNDRIIAYLEIFGAILLISFWIGWFLGFLKSFSQGDPLYETYMAFESSFPIADFWIVILLLVSAYGILTDKSYGSIFAASAGGALVFLGLIDITFNLQQGVYQHDIFAVFINLIAIIGGGLFLGWFYRYHLKD